MKKIFRIYVHLSLLKICAKFLGKVTKEKQVRGKKKHLSTFIQVPPFLFMFRSTSSLIVQIIKKNKHGQHELEKPFLDLTLKPQ